MNLYDKTPILGFILLVVIGIVLAGTFYLINVQPTGLTYDQYRTGCAFTFQGAEHDAITQGEHDQAKLDYDVCLKEADNIYGK